MSQLVKYNNKIWLHVKSGKLYKTAQTVFNVNTQKTAILYKPVDEAIIPNGCEYFSRDEEDFHSLEPSTGNPKFQLTRPKLEKLWVTSDLVNELSKPSDSK